MSQYDIILKLQIALLGYNNSKIKVFVSLQNIPIGYSPPPFPSIYWPLGKDEAKYQASFIYDGFTIWLFTVYWTGIFFVSLHLFAGLLGFTSFNLNKYRYNLISKTSFLESLLMLFFYIVLGAFKGFAAGAIIGLLLAAIYTNGNLSMSSWIPFCWGCALIMFDICSSYRQSEGMM